MSEESDKPTVENIEQLVEMSKKVSELEMSNTSLNDKLKEYEEKITKQNDDIIRLQKIIADNFIASKEKPQSDISVSKSFSDKYLEMINKNSK